MANAKVERRWCRCANASGMSYARNGRWFCADCDGAVGIVADAVEFQVPELGYRRAKNK